MPDTGVVEMESRAGFGMCEGGQVGGFKVDETPEFATHICTPGDGNIRVLDTGAPTESEQSLLNRDPSNPINNDSEDSDAYASSATGFRERFGCSSAAISHLKKQAQFYFDSYPGVDNEAPNTAAHTMLRDLLAGKVTTESSLAAVEQLLTFRLSLSAMATDLLGAAGIPLPKGRRRCNFNLDKFDSWCYDHPASLIAKNYDRAMDLIFRNVLPDPTTGTNQGRRWNKPHHYLAAAVACDPATKNAQDVEAAVKKLEQGISILCLYASFPVLTYCTAYQANFDDIKRNLDRNPDVRGRKAGIFQRLGKRLRSISPNKGMHRKRASTGASGRAYPLSPLSSPPKLSSPDRKSVQESEKR